MATDGFEATTTPAGAPRHTVVNAKRVYRVMRTHGLLQRRLMPPQVQRRRNGKAAVHKTNRRWCSDGFEFRCENGDPLRVTFALDFC